MFGKEMSIIHPVTGALFGVWAPAGLITGADIFRPLLKAELENCGPWVLLLLSSPVIFKTGQKSRVVCS